MFPAGLAFLLALIVLVLCVVFAVIGKVTTLVAVLIGGVALAILCLWGRIPNP